jgi:hypothetical protein
MFHSLTACLCQQGHLYVNYLSSVWGRVVVLVLSKLSVCEWPAVTCPIDIYFKLAFYFTLVFLGHYRVIELMCIVKLAPCQYMKE